MRSIHLHRFVTAVAAGIVLACAPDGTAPVEHPGPTFSMASQGSSSYLILGKGNKLPKNLATLVSLYGGTMTTSVPDIGVAMAESSNPDFQARASAIPGVEAVAADQVIQWVSPNERVVEATGLSGSGVGGSSIGDDETFFGFYQWAPKAIHAPEAWDLGARGTGVRVAVIDGGLNNNHIDLNGSVDVAHSASFVPGFAFNEELPCGTPCFWHATHVAGIIAARDNGIGTIGVAPGATIIGVKVLNGGSGSFGAVIAGIVYAATPISKGGAGANIINMSLGAGFDRQGRDAAHLANALSRATTYAYQQGVTVIASAGNDAVDIDHTNNLIFVPAQSTHVIAVSATGPVGYAFGATNFTQPATYTNFGQSAITFAAPGGNDAFFPDPNFVLDFVLSPASGAPVNNVYYFAEGTSMAAPHVAGVAALIIEKNGGSMKPSQVEAALRHSADDLGKPGNDDFYGRGFVNALRAVQ